MRTVRIVFVAASSVLVALPVALAGPPVAVSPAGVSATACPTFSWSLAEGASGYELVVYRVAEAGEVTPEPVLSARLPAGVQSWTASAERCLEPGGAYAWSLRALTEDGAEAWSEAALFEVAAAPSVTEVEAALATLRRHLAATRASHASTDEAAGATAGRDPRGAVGSVPGPRHRARSAPLLSLGAGASLVAGDAPAPSATPSLTVSDQIHLGAGSDVFKDGAVFLWDDTSGNLALGENALASATGNATNNIAVGQEALRYTTYGFSMSDGSYNTAVGDRTLLSNTTGSYNTASGHWALYSNTTGNLNTASGSLALRFNDEGFLNTATGSRALHSNMTGYGNTANGALALFSNTIGTRNIANGSRALYSNTEGSRNTAVGYGAGFRATTGNDNIFLGSGADGQTGDSNTIRIGGDTGTGTGEQDRTFIAGIRGITTGSSDRATVLIDVNGQLGTETSSLAVKQDVRDVGELSERLLELRPVAFRYRQHAAADPETPLQFGLIAEEVADVFPELVIYDEAGNPETVKYHLLASLLLNELQREVAVNETQRMELQRLRRENAVRDERLEALERGDKASQRRDAWWRRR